MTEIKPGVLHTEDDKEVLEIIAMLKGRGIPIPDFRETSGKNFMFPVIYYDKAFCLYLIQYFGHAGDSGYTATHITNFMTENKFNLKECCDKFGYDLESFTTLLLMQAQQVARSVRSPLYISMCVSDDFVGLVAQEHHPADVLNKTGKRN